MKLLGVFQQETKEFYTLFENVAQNNVKAAKLLERFCKNFTAEKDIPKQITAIEHENDKYAHQLYEAVDQVFMPPIDREDIIALGKSLDDVTDFLHHSAQMMTIYNIKKVTPTGIALAETITQATKIVSDILPKLRSKSNFSEIHKAIVEINRLENNGDDLLEKGIKELFTNQKDAVYIIQWRDIYHILGATTDKIEDIGDILRSLVTKYG